jgi:cyclopropane fatty-acyl-phospholipid synthase-like methyltransferase
MLRVTGDVAKVVPDAQEHLSGSAEARQFWTTSVAAFATADALGHFYATRAMLSGEMLRDMGNGLRVLEVGCGSGRLAALLAQEGHKVTALDLSIEQLTRTRERCEGYTVDLRLGGLEALDANERFDAVFALGVLPYIPDQPSYAATLGRRVVGGGRLCLSITRAASIFTAIEVVRHMTRFRPSAPWWGVAINLMRTGIWSGGFVAPCERISIDGQHGLNRTMRQQGFRTIDHFALFNIAALDRAPHRRGAIAARLADCLGWSLVSACERQR